MSLSSISSARWYLRDVWNTWVAATKRRSAAAELHKVVVIEWSDGPL